MKYFIDTEFLEGPQNKTLFGISYGKTKPTIDLISIGIVAEDGRKYYAISKDFNLKEAWNRFYLKHTGFGDRNNLPPIKDYWIRNNVLKNLFNNHVANYNKEINTLKEFKNLVKHFGKTDKQIAEEVINFTHINICYPNVAKEQAYNNKKMFDVPRPEFYGYFADYDWVAFCWLFGKMIDLPTSFQMYCIDLKQDQDILNKKLDFFNKYTNKESYNIQEHLKYPKQINEHNALADAQ